jgi:hypothetical protein
MRRLLILLALVLLIAILASCKKDVPQSPQTIVKIRGY